jgi:hypothetical protein
LILRAAIETARGLAGEVSTIEGTLHDRFADLEALDYPGRESLEVDVGRARVALREAATALGRIGFFHIPDDAARVALRAAQPERFEVPDLMRELMTRIDADREAESDGTQP